MDALYRCIQYELRLAFMNVQVWRERLEDGSMRYVGSGATIAYSVLPLITIPAAARASCPPQSSLGPILGPFIRPV